MATVMTAKRRAIARLALAEVLAMSLWFAAASVLPQLRAAFAMSAVQEVALSSGVAFGFVLGTLVSAGLGLADRLDPRRLFEICAVVAAPANAASTAGAADLRGGHRAARGGGRVLRGDLSRGHETGGRLGVW